MNLKISRAKLESMIDELVQRTLEPCKKALADANKKPADIHEVVLVGGSTRIPMVQEAVKKFFGKEPHKGVNPDEVVAIGAAVQAGVLSGDVKDMVLLDVTPLSLGVETLGGVMTVQIPRNTTIPTRREESFSTAEDSQSKVEIHVLQGERAEARSNRTLGRFHLEGIMPAPRGVPKIKVTFDIDANGILSVMARDEATGKDQKITITSNSGLSESDIGRMVDEGKQHESEDKTRREQVETRNRADQLCYQVEKALDDAKDKIAADKAAVARQAVTDLRAAIDKQDHEAINSGLQKLEAVMGEIAQKAYEAAGGDAAEGAAPGGAGGGGGGPAAGGEDGFGQQGFDPEGFGPDGSGKGGPSPDDVVEGEFRET